MNYESEVGVSQNWGYHFGGPYTKGYSILGSLLGCPHFGKLPSKWSSFLIAAMNMRALRACLQERQLSERVEQCWAESKGSVVRAQSDANIPGSQQTTNHVVQEWHGAL